jgi:hypothetical protein
MSAQTVLRRGRLAGAVIPAIALGIAGLVVAQSGGQAAAKTPALRVGPKISLGTTANVFGNAFAQAPDGTVFYSRGSVVYVVRGNSRPKTAVRAGRTVLALAANEAGLFVQTGDAVTEYSRSSGAKLRHWTLSSEHRITSAGLYAVGSVLWSWTDWATDGSGLELATVSRIGTGGAAVRVISRLAYPGAVAADSAGLYFESTTETVTPNFLEHVTTTGTVRTRRTAAATGQPITLAGGRVYLLAFGSHESVNGYNGASLALVTSKRVYGGADAIAGVGFGLAVLAQACHGASCAAPTVSRLDAATGTTSGGVRVPGAVILLPGPQAIVIEVSHLSHGQMTMRRIGS